MSDILATKYRPKKLSDMIGQDHAVKILTNTILYGNLHHSYIFAGFFGSGKTSAARVFAASLNSPSGPTLEPDMSSSVVQEIFEGKSIDVMEMDAASNRGIDEIRNLREEIKFSPIHCRYRFVILDECLDKNSRIDTDIGRIPVGVIVNNKLTPKVKSYNHNTGKVEYKKITGWFKNPGKEIFKVSFEGKGAVYVSSGHLFATPNGYKSLSNLIVGDKVLRYGKSFSYIQKQLLYGSLLGDMCIQRNVSQSKKGIFVSSNKTCRARVKMVHGQSQIDYLEFKKDILSDNISFSRRDFVHSGFGGDRKPMRSYISKTSSALSEIFETVINTNNKRPTKTISRAWLDKLDDIGIAIWFCDDGSVQKYKVISGEYRPVVYFHTQGFSKKENEIICDWFLSKGIYAKTYSVYKNNRYLYYIALSTDSSVKLLERISPYIHPSMRYKIKGLSGLKEFNADLFYKYKKTDNNVSQEAVPEMITCIKSLGYKDCTYDLEIEDNHNYFCSDTLLHNCHSLTGAAAEAALKMVEEPPKNTIFIFATTDPQNMIPTIRSRSMTIKFNKVQWGVLHQHLCKVADAEGVSYDTDALKIAARRSSGSVRNSLQNLQTLITFAGKEKITLDIANEALQYIDESKFFDLLDAIIGVPDGKPNAAKGYKVIEDIMADGRDIGEVLDNLTNHFRHLLLISTCSQTSGLLYLTEDEKKRYVHQRQKIGNSANSILFISQMIDLIAECNKQIMVNLNPQAVLENFVIKAILSFASINKSQ